MAMLKPMEIARRKLVEMLWQRYLEHVPEARAVAHEFKFLGAPAILDHFAIIDLPGPNGGISVLREIFALLGYEQAGSDYLPEKQNPFIWMKIQGAEAQDARTVPPQVVLADFRLSECDERVRAIVERIAASQGPVPMDRIRELAARAETGAPGAVDALVDLVFSFLVSMPRERVTREEAEYVLQHNELLGWVLVFGKEVNHFGLGIHLTDRWGSLEQFNAHIAAAAGVKISQTGGLSIKGGADDGIRQSATLHQQTTIPLPGGTVQLPNRFFEFVWRRQHAGLARTVGRWGDYFQGFFATNANKVVESLHQSRLSQA